MIALWITTLFFIVTAIQVGMILYFYYPLSRHTPATNSIDSNQIPVTILICGHNEAANFKRNLPRILTQNYRSYQVLVINHNSTDESEKVLRSLQRRYAHLVYYNYNDPQKRAGKKFALAYGIEKALHDVLLLTDADCVPRTDQWLLQMQSLLREPYQIGLGFGPYEQQTGFLNLFIRFETFLTAVQYFSFALAGIPYMGVGRNLIYHKNVYRNAKRFHQHNDLAGGDDDLLIGEMSNRQNTTFSIHPDTFVYSAPKKTWRDWIRQKTRHLSTSTRYSFLHQLLLGSISATHLLHYACGLLLIFSGHWQIFLIGYLSRMRLLLGAYKGILDKLDDAILLKWIPLLDIAFCFYYIFFAPVLFLHKKRRW